MDDTGAKSVSDRDYRKEAQSDEFGRSGSDPNLAPAAFIFWGTVNTMTRYFPWNRRYSLRSVGGENWSSDGN